jgi:hypothetical protein
MVRLIDRVCQLVLGIMDHVWPLPHDEQVVRMDV